MRRLKQQSNLKNARGSIGAGLLDLYPTAQFGYSFRRLRDAYTGACIRVRRASDNVETDIGFINEGSAYWIDENALISFTGASIAHVVKIYDQSTNANHAVQNTAINQLVICIAGVIVKNGTRPTFTFTGTEFYNILQIDGNLKWSTFKIVQAGNINVVDTPTIGGTSFNLYDTHQYNADRLFYVWGNEGYVRMQANNLVLPMPKGILSTIYAYNSTILYQNATERPIIGGAALTNSAKFLLLGKVGGADFCAGNFQEYVFYGTDKTTTRAAIVANINAAFLVY